MSSSKVTNQVLLGSIAFGISCGLGFAVNRDLNKALLTGAISLPAVYAGTFMVGKRGSQLVRLSADEAITPEFSQEDLVSQGQVDLFDTNEVQAEFDPNLPSIFPSQQHQEELQVEIDRLTRHHQDLTTQANELEQQVTTLQAEHQKLHETLTPLQQHYQNITVRVQNSQADLGKR